MSRSTPLVECLCPLVLSCLLALPGILLAQTPAPHAASSLSGHVHGPGNVAVPGATVELINPQTGAHKETWTGTAGNYAFSGLAPGNYKLIVSLVGFRDDVREPVPVSAAKPLNVNVSLVLAIPQAPELAGGSSASGRSRPPGLGSLPSQNRSALPGQAGGWAAAGGQSGSSNGLSGAGATANVRFSENAGGEAQANAESGSDSGGEAGAGANDSQASASNSFLLSGSVGEAPTPEGDGRDMRERIIEFRQAQRGAPGFGGGGGFGGGPVIFFAGGRFVGRRPRVNRLRGNLFDGYSNSALNARPYSLNGAVSPQIPSYREQAGASLGGPLVIPKLYNGRDKTSFFVNFNLQRGKSPFDSFSTVPTAAERAGDFSQAVLSSPSGPLAGKVPTLYDPSSNPLGPRTAFPGNQIPASRFDPAAVGLLQFIPLPNLPGTVQNFHLRESLPLASDRLMARVGHEISSKDNANVFYFLNSAHSSSVSSFPDLSSTRSTRSQSVNFGETHTFTSQSINNFTLGFNRQRVSTLNPFAFKQNISGDLGIQGISQNPYDWGLPIISFTNFAGLDDTIPSLTRNQTWRAVDTVILHHGKHNLRVGGEVRRVDLATLTDPDARGTFTFTGYTTSDFSAQGLPVAGTGLDFADFLLGLPQATSARFGSASNYFHTWVYSGFAQDDWRASSKLTFDLGVRYEYFRPFTEQYGHLSDLEIGPGYTTLGVITGQQPGQFPASLIRGDARNFAPRVGIAFRPWSKRQLVFRAGYGIFYDGSIFQRLIPNLADQPPFAEASTLLTTPAQVLTLQNGFPQIAPTIARNTYAVDPNFRTPYGQTWDFNVQDEIARNVILSVGYLGTKGSHLDLLLGPNPASINGQSLASSRSLQYTYETDGASSIYNALEVTLRRQFHQGLSARATYTYSKSIDDASSIGGAGGLVAQNYLDLAAERGLSTFDQRHDLSLNWEYELPFGDRKAYLNHGGALARVLGNWQVSGYSSLESGTPFTARVLGNVAGSGGTGAYFSLRPDATGEAVSIPGFERTTTRYFNTAAFALPLAGAFGNAGRNTIPGPPSVDVTMSLDRFMTLSREKNTGLDFRVSANNVFNTPNFTGLATVINASDFGRVTSVGLMRSLNFSVRFRF